MPRWNPEANKVNKNLLVPIILLGLATYLFVFVVINFLSNAIGIIQILNVVGSSALIIYVSGRLYGELFKHRDYIDISSKGIIFRETPVFGAGWLPINKHVKFEDIKSADAVEVNSMFSPNKKHMAILLWPKIGKQIIIGSQLSNNQLIKIGLALRGTIVLSHSLEKILGSEKVGKTIKDVFDGAKKFYDKYQESKGVKNG